MQTPAAPRRAGNPILREGLIFGIIVVVVQVVLNLLGNVINPGFALSVLSFILSLALYLLAGMRASQQTARVSTGALAGLVAGLIAGLLSAVYTVVYTFTNVDALRRSAQAASPTVQVTNQLILTIAIVGIIFSFVLMALLGLGLGALGGLMGKKRAKVQPQAYQESFYQPDQPDQYQDESP
jgi:hypothetical protein